MVWNPRSFFCIDVLEKGQIQRLSSATEILSPLSEWPVSGAQEGDCKLIANADNVRPHTARLSVEFFEDDWIKLASHSAYSPDIAPSDLYHSGYVKGYLAGCSVVDGKKLFESVPGVLDSIKKVTVQLVFLEWMDRLSKCIQTNGEYME
jgi:hypothetical protein